MHWFDLNWEKKPATKAQTKSLASIRARWRKGRDSNPRRRFRLTRFPGVPIQPLSHPSYASKFYCNYNILQKSFICTLIKPIVSIINVVIHKYIHFFTYTYSNEIQRQPDEMI